MKENSTSINQNIIVKIYTYYFVTSILLVAGNKTITELFLLLGERKFGILSKERIILLAFLSLIGTTILFLRRNLFITKKTLLAIYLILIFVLSIFILAFTNNLGVKKFFDEVFYYYWIALFFMFYGMKITFIEEVNVKKMFGIYILAQCFLGIMQYVLRKPFVITTYKGEPLLNTIYYLNGISSANDILYYMGAQVRAFGLTDSGLTLGLFSLALFSGYFYTVFSKRKFEKLISLFIIFVTLLCSFMTITRNIYLTGLCLIILLIFLKSVSSFKVKIVKIYYLSMIIFNFIFVTSAEIFINLLSTKFTNFNFSTLYSRTIGYHQVFNQIEIDFVHILFGSGVVPSRQLFIDNDFLFIFANVGIVIYVMVQIIIICVLFKGLNGLLSNKYNSSFIKGLIVFLASYPIISLINAVIYVYFPIALIIYALLLNMDKKHNSVI
ncbi:hypothetical protein [Bacillus sp. EAC]|uniref:hypothetical protein n=1 Tax=Bacillus sp. EAC TaxID=1978338 RepID=UPI000B43935C|nr:hypothetical protein [Bacillus sp. EAC]